MNRTQQLSAIALVIGGVVCLSIIGNRLPGQLDLTAARAFTIGEASKSMLRGLEEPVQLEFHFSRSLEGLPIQLKNYGTRVEELLRQYERASGGNLRLSVVDPRPDTDEEQAAIRAGLRAQPLSSGENLFFGMVAHLAENTAAIPFFSPNREAFLEYDISQLIHQVGQVDQPVIGILSSLELESMPNPMQPAAADGPAFLTELRRFAEVRILEDETGINGEIDVLMVLHLQEPGQAALYAIDQFVMSGRPTLLAVDPSAYVQRSQQMNNMMMGMPGMQNASSDLPPLLAAWGIDYDPTAVVGDLQLAAPVSTQAGGPPTRFPVWLNFTEVQSDSPLLASLSNLLLVEAGHFRAAETMPEGVTWSPLLQSSGQSGDVNAQSLAFSMPEQVARTLTVDGTPRTLAGILTGPLPSAFPEGPPPAEAPGEEEQEAANETPGDEAAANSHLAKASGSATVILIGDSDFLANDFSVQIMNLFGMRAMNQINDNLSLLFNAVDSLSGNPALIALRGRGTGVRPFKRVQEIEVQAQAAYQEQLQTLEDRLAGVRQQLAELQQRTPQSGMLIADEATEQAIEQFRLEEAEVRAEQRQIRKSLREDIEALNLRLALLNLLLAPLCITIGGIWYLRKRSTGKLASPAAS